LLDLIPGERIHPRALVLPGRVVPTQQDRLLNAAAFGSMNITHEVRLGRLLLHSGKGPEPTYDGEVWAWSGRELNRIAYVDGQGDL
jgi:hypothetical protein